MLAFYLFEAMDSRRSTREFSDRPPQRVQLKTQTASTVPLPAIQAKPWTLRVENSEIKKQIRIAAEEEEMQL
jgi:hypothetical protein